MRTRMSGGVTGKAGDSLPMSIRALSGNPPSLSAKSLADNALMCDTAGCGKTSHSAQCLDHGGLTMRKRSLLFLSVLFPAFLVLGGYAVVQAQQKTSSTASGKRWSDAATWPDKKVPDKDAED